MLHAEFTCSIGDFFLETSFNLGAETGVLFGPSGAGKSMTLRVLSGLKTPSDGEIVLGERILFSKAKKINLPPRDRRIGLLTAAAVLTGEIAGAEVREGVLQAEGPNVC
jgi:molybdate transport system ATP-binding protein